MKKFKELVAKVKTVGKERQVWLTNEKFNELSNLKFRLTRKNNIVISKGDVEIEISTNEKLHSNCGTFCVKILRVWENFPNTQLKRKDIYTAPQGSCQIIIL